MDSAQRTDVTLFMLVRKLQDMSDQEINDCINVFNTEVSPCLKQLPSELRASAIISISLNCAVDQIAEKAPGIIQFLD